MVLTHFDRIIGEGWSMKKIEDMLFNFYNLMIIMTIYESSKIYNEKNWTKKLI